MKGIVFTEFLDMVENNFSLEIADRIITNSDLESGGIYTSVGTYHHSEIVALVTELSKETSIEVPDLLKVYGKHLFKRFFELYPDFFTDVDDAISFLAKVDQYIHVEVKKLYPDASLPNFEYEEVTSERLSFIYRSKHPFAIFAEGLIEGCVEHFGGGMSVVREDLDAKDGTAARFIVEKAA